MFDFDTTAPYAHKTSSPDWMQDGLCECGLPFCPTCDVDFYVDQMRDDAYLWDNELEPPF